MKKIVCYIVNLFALALMGFSFMAGALMAESIDDNYDLLELLKKLKKKFSKRRYTEVERKED